MKLHLLSKRQRLAYGQEKGTSTIEKLNEEICSTLELPSQESLFESPKPAEQNEKLKKLQKQANDLAIWNQAI